MMKEYQLKKIIKILIVAMPCICCLILISAVAQVWFPSTVWMNTIKSGILLLGFFMFGFLAADFIKRIKFPHNEK